MESLLLLGITLILAGVLLIVLEVFVPSAGILSMPIWATVKRLVTVKYNTRPE